MVCNAAVMFLYVGKKVVSEDKFVLLQREKIQSSDLKNAGDENNTPGQ